MDIIARSYLQGIISLNEAKKKLENFGYTQQEISSIVAGWKLSKKYI